VEPALNSVDLEEVIQCCDNEEKLKSESECKDAITDNVEHDVEVEIISNGRTPKVPKEECISRCRETTGSPLEILQTHALKVCFLLIVPSSYIRLSFKLRSVISFKD